MAELTIKHMKAAYGWEPSIEEITVDMPYHKQVGAWKDALAYFKMDGYYFALEDVPEPVEGMSVCIRVPGVTEYWRYESGKWWKYQDAPDSIYKP